MHAALSGALTEPLLIFWDGNIEDKLFCIDRGFEKQKSRVTFISLDREMEDHSYSGSGF